MYFEVVVFFLCGCDFYIKAIMGGGYKPSKYRSNADLALSISLSENRLFSSFLMIGDDVSPVFEIRYSNVYSNIPCIFSFLSIARLIDSFGQAKLG